MLCNDCGKNPATVHTVKIINGEKTEEYLCEECAQKRQDANAFSTGDLLKSFFEFGSMPSIRSIVCKNCGTSAMDFRRTGLLGCSECYRDLSEEVIPVLTKIHGKVEHTGFSPQETGENAKRMKRLSDLKDQLSTAIKEERFEDAAKLRDEINSLNQEENK